MARETIQTLSCAGLLLVVLFGLFVQDVSAVTCTKRTFENGFVGGGFLTDDEYVLVNNHPTPEGLPWYTNISYYSTSTGARTRNEVKLEAGSRLAITCPNKQRIAITMVVHQLNAIDPPIVRPYVYNGNGSEIGTILRSSYDYGDWQMHLSRDCQRLLVRSDDEKSQMYAVEKLGKGAINSFDSRKDGPWMQLASNTIMYSGDVQTMRKVQLLGQPGQSRKAKLLYRFTVSGTIRNFAISPNGKFMFAVGTVQGVKAYKNLVLTSGRGRLLIDPDDADLDSIYTAYSPTGKYFAATFKRSVGNALKVYNSTGSYNGQLQHTLLDGTAATKVFFSPSGNKLLVFGDAASKSYWLCGDLA